MDAAASVPRLWSMGWSSHISVPRILDPATDTQRRAVRMIPKNKMFEDTSLACFICVLVKKKSREPTMGI